MRLTLAAVAATALLSSTSAVPAHAAVTQPTGSLCGWGSSDDDGDGTWSVSFSAGPLRLVDEDDPTVVHTGTVRCSVQATDAAHSGVDTASVTSGPLPTHAYLPSTTADVSLDEDPFFTENYLCTEVVVDGTTLYWHDHPNRNSDGYWTTNPASRCANLWETLELRIGEDEPTGTAYSALATAYGEFDGACGLAPCGSLVEPGGWSSVSFARLSAGGAVVRTSPYGWTCTDVHAGTVVTPGSLLSVPDPGVACTPPSGSGIACDRREVTGALAPTGTGRVAVTAACGSQSVTRWLTPVQGSVVQDWSKSFGNGALPFRCTTAEDLRSAAEPAYVVACVVIDY